MKTRTSFSTFSGLVVLLLFAGAATGESGVSEWPREFETAKGHTIVLYQPQAETFAGDRVTGRAAVSFTKKGETAPKFGVFFFTARVSVDRDARLVSVLDLKVTRVRFPGITPENEKKFADNVEAEVPKWDLAFSYDRLLENVKVAAKEKRSAEGLRHEPPRIVFSEEPAVLVTFDGAPAFREVEGAPVKVAVNTSALVLADTRSGRHWLSGGKSWWYEAADPLGPWRPVGGPPPDVAAFAAKAMEEHRKADAQAADDDGTDSASPPRIIVATEPTELVVTEGRPALKPVAGTDGNLLAVDNTESDVLFDVAAQQYYVLLSGRWFRGKSLAASAAWAYVASDALPPSFAKIPPESDSGDVRASVAGTDEAEEAVLDAQIPQTTAVVRREATLDVVWDGEPKFIPIEGSQTAYAANASTAVLSIRGRYYACDNAVWFISVSPEGPWRVAESIPSDEIDALPPSAPVYNVKYVRIYDATPDVVWFGYTPGYTGVYPWRGTVVWGTGWHYRPWLGPTYYWPRPYTWGYCAHYNPWIGWGFGTSWSHPFFSVSVGWGGWFWPRGWYLPPGRGWGGGGHRPGGWGWYGPGGYHPPAVVVNNYGRGRPGAAWNRPLPGPRTGAVRPASRPLPGVKPDIGFRPLARDARPTASTNIYNRLPPRTREAQKPPVSVERPRPATTRPNDVYGDRSGNVYRRTQEGWQRREGGRWQPSDGGKKAQGPAAAPTRLPGSSNLRPAPIPELDRDHAARQRGETRVREKSRDASPPAPNPSPKPKEAGERRKGAAKEQPR